MLKKQDDQNKFDSTFTKKLRVAIIRPDYHHQLNLNLENNCRQTLIKHGLSKSNVVTYVAPGSWEIPITAQKVAKSGGFDAIVAFGIIVKGETYHFEMIANEVARTLMQISLDFSIPIALEVLAVFDIAQAKARATNDQHNKGIEGAIAVLKTLKVLESIS
ncbi:6,7-dimethyl-8-ribityllumazine synthase [bacterium]|nr:6,7-dimethyl-8-ribityllumazine synthase [bacterium]